MNLSEIQALIQTIHQLRAPGGCPWDQKQTHLSLRPYLIEEAYETLAVLDQMETDKNLSPELYPELKEELGDVLMQILLHSDIADEKGAFNFLDVASHLNKKLIRRHPHVFDTAQLSSVEEVLTHWEAIKEKEKAHKKENGLFSGLPAHLPALTRGNRVMAKVRAVGFRWQSIDRAIAKVEEEWTELKNELPNDRSEASEKHPKQRIEEELGDVLLTLCGLAQDLDIQAEDALRSATRRFEKRFRWVEIQATLHGKSLQEASPSDFQAYWIKAKHMESVTVIGLTGGIASGKSHAGKVFEKLGIPVIDADQIARDLSQKEGPAQELLVKRFGTHDPKELRALIFNDPKAKSDLENLLHPLIQKESFSQLLRLSEDHSVLVYEATLLAETGRYKDLSWVIAVEAPEEMRLDRLKKRSGIEDELALRILQSQIPEKERRKIAHFVVENSGTLDAFEKKLIALAQSQKWCI